MAPLEDPLEIGGVEVPNRLYRAPLLECAGTGPDAVETLIDDLEPAAESGVGLICQGATIVRGEGGCAAPGMTRVHDPEFVSQLSGLTERVHNHGGRIFLQLEHGGLRSMETWHAERRRQHPDLEQLAVSEPPWQLRVLDRLGFLSYDPHVLSAEEVYALAEDFGRSAAYAVDAGYDGIHISGANMGIVQQFLSPFYNRREDEFGGSPEARLEFLAVVHDEIRDRAGDVPVITKVPAETPAPPAPVVRRKLSLEDGVEIARRLEKIGYDAVVPVRASVVWDMSIVRGEYPERAWNSETLHEEYDAAFGGSGRRRLVALGNWLESLQYDFEPAWNEDFCRRVREETSIPVLAEGGIRDRERIDRLLGDSGEAPACDMVGMARPFYAEPRLGARLLENDDATRVLCESCNNCTIPQATGAPGICRTPDVLRKRGELEQQGAYDRA
ncbi:oxidoreductase [Natronobacterium gregoryi]|uniref:NADH-dependent flavin oxidoreductase n=2 Tax=Natronobacterium gregoryi TaxID=44930 RepID=L0AH23_NATGS|nr:NADH-dependent flavin oxidoreductase [Natronobacterium gregoryi]AFZ72724.1 NADH:flavin oxidoreductase [Natronobacterium gregoryi SP2]ELY69222.1 NADH:flavin oxidoreductase/NADH oxidase [Natronobacterium gregoryi SP2]PLK18446.1 NADH-dependent flavin oxidoreductase [Natronobacterium gregoryi SP2]SFJ70845.1 2,4-dienoyl-CoA reductase [Natronobacterium gregoryi]